MENTDQKGIEFLNRLYKDMYKSEDVMHGIEERFIGNKVDNISRYIDRMYDLHERVTSSGRAHDLDLLKQFYYRKYVIREEDIPESYFDHHKKSCIDRGEEFTVEKRQEIRNAVINDQKKSLDNWINYFVSSDSSYIPMWAKYWAFQGMLSFGTYDKKIEGYCKRSKSTTSPFIDLNLEALGMSIDLLLKVLKKEEIDDKQLEVLVQGGSFGKIYSYITTKLLSKTSNVSKSNQGIWKKYERDSDYVPLVKSLQGYNTGWSTAGEGWAMMYLSKGDNYVYYTYNEKGEAVIPRIAIKMNENQISEIRGIKEWQDLEPEMVEIVEKKLNEFSNKLNIDEYKKKVSDMKRLTAIYQKFKNKDILSKEDLIFVYEIDDKIEGFVDKKDSRIDEIIMNRDKISDLNNIFDGIDVFEGNFDFKYLEVANGLKLPKVLNGNLDLSGLKTAEGLELPEELNGDLNLSGLKTTEGLKLPRILKGNLDLSGLTTAEGLKLPEELTGSLSLVSLTDAQNIVFPEKFNGGLLLNSLKNIFNMYLNV